MPRISEQVTIRIRNAIIVLMTVCVFGLLFSKPGLPQWWKANANDLICMIAILGFSLILLFNKFACGVFFPGPPKSANKPPAA
jgi:hypothetical protein